jgi:hypothetical protein
MAAARAHLLIELSLLGKNFVRPSLFFPVKTSIQGA